MPEITRFYGMIIKMYFQQKEHNPPHVHVIYGSYMGAIEIQSQKCLRVLCRPRRWQWRVNG